MTKSEMIEQFNAWMDAHYAEGRSLGGSWGTNQSFSPSAVNRAMFAAEICWLNPPNEDAPQ